VARPVAPSPPAPAQPASRVEPFSFLADPPRAPAAPPPAPSLPLSPPAAAAAEDDWSDVELTPSEPRKVPAAAPPEVRPPPPSPPPDLVPVPEPTPTLELEPASGFEPIELSAEEPTGPPLALAPMHEFVPPPATTGHQPAPVVPQGGAGVVAGQVTPADGGEARLREALSRASREVIERVVWEVVPQLAETIIRENLDRLIKARQG
jgi:hypothetical protein